MWLYYAIYTYLRIDLIYYQFGAIYFYLTIEKFDLKTEILTFFDLTDFSKFSLFRSNFSSF